MGLVGWIKQVVRLNWKLRREILRMRAEDLAVRRKLIQAGKLYGPHLPEGFYHPQMAAVHRRNNARMGAILSRYGWPGHSLVGKKGAEAAWVIIQHAILDPELQQRSLELLAAAVEEGEALPRHHAMLLDRVLMEKGEPQVYGSIYIGGENGQLVPWKIANPHEVNALRQGVGLPPLEENTVRLQERVNVEESVQRQAASWKVGGSG